MVNKNREKFRRVASIECELIRTKNNSDLSAQTLSFNYSGDVNGFDPTIKLNNDLTVSSAGNHLYECGLSFYQFSSHKRFFTPRRIFVLNSVILLRAILSMCLPENSGKVFIYLGDSSHVLKARYHINPAIIGFAVLVLIAQALHYWEFKQNKRPAYLKPFTMISGQCSPHEIGLINETDILYLAKVFRWGFKCLHYFDTTFVIMAFTLAFVPLIPFYRWIDLLLFGLPWSVVFAIYLNSTLYISACLNIYFYIICTYESAKLKQSNIDIKNKLETKIRNYKSIMDLIRYLNSIYKEIQEFNDSIWSKYTFVLVSLQGFVINLFLFESLYGSMQWFLRIIFLYISLISALFSLFYLITNSMISKRAFKAYKSINNLYIDYNRWSLPTMTRLKMLVFIERLAANRIGFYCWDLFMISDYAILQIVLSNAGFFLKLAEVSVFD